MLSNRLQKLIDKAEVVSFDIFDTLLLRSYASPESVFDALAQVNSAPDFASARKAAEPTAWRDLVTATKDDVTLDEIYKYMPKKFQAIKTAEVEFESSHLFANPEMLDALNYALKQNKRVIITSDMYLPATELKNILVRELKTDKFDLYVSSEIGKRKHTGKLFKHIVNDLNIKPSKILHIGDNIESDYNMPRKNGWRAYLYNPPIKQFLKNQRVKRFLTQHKSVASDRFIGTLALMYAIFCKNDVRDYWDTVAFLYGGPLAYNYVKMISDCAVTANLTDICFVARDGYTLKRVFDIINPHTQIKSHYVYAPRFTNTLAYIDFGNKNVLAERKNVLLKFLIDKGIATPSDSIEQHMSTLKKFAATERDEYKMYLDKLHLGKRVGIVDSISMSYSAQKLITKNLDSTDTVGFYWWTIPVDDQEKPNLHQFYNGKNRPGFCHLIEFFFAAPERPIHRIVNGKPIYKENIDKYEQIKIDLYPTISKAMTEFASIAMEYGLAPVVDDDAMFDWINNFVVLADNNDYKQFHNIKNGVDQSHTKYDPVLPKTRKPKYHKILREIRHIFFRKKHNENWTKVYIFGIRVFTLSEKKRKCT